LNRESLEAMRRSHDDERNPARFYVSYWKRAFAGDFGFSRSLGRPIRELLVERAPTTAGLMFGGIAAAWAIALLLTVPPVTCRLPWLAGMGTVFSGVSASIPSAGMAILLFRLGGSARWIIAMVLFPKLYQYLRNLLRQSYGMPHVLLARAKGLGSFRILGWHVLPSAMAQLIALAAVSINLAFGAAIAVEAICDLPGLGQLAWKAALARDLPVLVILTVVITLATQISNLMADACSPVARSQS
jgi:peptide/nickel transport system permease protein